MCGTERDLRVGGLVVGLVLVPHEARAPRAQLGDHSQCVGTLRSSSSSQMRAEASEGARQSPRGDSDPQADLGTVRHRRSLELAEPEETFDEHRQPLPDVGKLVGDSGRGRVSGWPVAAGWVVPGVPGDEGSLRGGESVTECVEEEEVVEVVGSDRGLGALGRLTGCGGNQLGADHGVQYSREGV